MLNEKEQNTILYVRKFINSSCRCNIIRPTGVYSGIEGIITKLCEKNQNEGFIDRNKIDIKWKLKNCDKRIENEIIDMRKT